MRHWLWVGALVLWLWLGGMGPAQATAVTDLPATPPASWVFDEADVFSPSTVNQVNRTLTQLSQDTGFQVHVVSLRRLDYGETASSFGEKLFQRWFPDGGAKQVLLTLVARTATADLQAGSEVIPLLPSATALSIVEDTLLKLVRRDVYNQALVDTVTRLQAVLSGQPDPGPPPEDVERIEGNFATAAETRQTKDISTAVVVVLLILATVIPMVTYYWYVQR
ncbi:MAG: TPM domain-containing protein [Gloeomargarita sp. SKYG116]|nr:TPM domain-containing protein [Gloeomargarita sp. SKYG116]MDW8400739.1 TPM domain-containing protein [Gloeomargarita sp. SKYGB_i_bin116]